MAKVRQETVTGTTGRYASDAVMKSAEDAHHRNINMLKQLLASPDMSKQETRAYEAALQNEYKLLEGLDDKSVEATAKGSAPASANKAERRARDNARARLDDVANDLLVDLAQSANTRGAAWESALASLGTAGTAATPDSGSDSTDVDAAGDSAAAGAAGDTDSGAGPASSATDARLREFLNDPESLVAEYEGNPDGFMDFYKDLSSEDRQLLMMKLNEQVQMQNQMFTMFSNLMQAMHQTSKAAINNLRV